MNILSRFQEMVNASKEFTMLEIGAFDGAHTRFFLEVLQSSKRPFSLNAFEPVPKNFAMLLQNAGPSRVSMDGSQSYSVNRIAIGAESGNAPFYVSGGNFPAYASSLREPTPAIARRWPGLEFTKEEASVTTLDEYWNQTGAIDFIWADIQGAEVDLINGGKETLKRVRYLYTEYYNAEYYKGQIGLAAIKALLPDFEVVEDYGEDVLLKNKNVA